MPVTSSKKRRDHRKKGKVEKQLKKVSWVVVKLDNELEEYSQEKVADVIFLTAQDVGGTDSALAKDLAKKVTFYLQLQFGRMKHISTRDVGDAVERVLIENHHIRTAKAYILNRDKKREEYEAKIRLGVKDDVGMGLNTLLIMKNKYLLKDDEGEVIETPRQAFERVAKALSQSEKGKRAQKEWYEKFLEVMVERRMLPGGRTLANAGTVNNQLANCFVIPFEDDIEAIFESVKDSSILKKNGGGVGFSFSKIRPKGDEVKTTSGSASGPVALMAILDHASGIFMQAGGRRSGNMVTLSVSHPDIFEFIACKESGANLPNINYSVEITNNFMRAVVNDEEWDLVNPRTSEVTQSVLARSVMDQMVRMAWKTGDPGLIFVDEINKYNPTPHVGRLETVNLCGEQPLLSHEACNLGSVNLANHLIAIKGKQSTVGDYEIDWDALEDTVCIGVRMLDNVVDVCTYPLEKIDKVVKGNRKIGLGVMGWADVLIRLGIPYNDPKAMRLARKMMRFVRDAAWETSNKLGSERGSFPNFRGSIWEKRGYKYFRNATVTTIAPTGSLSMAAGCSSGVEPHFALAYYRKSMGEYELPEVNEDLVNALKRSNGVYSSELMSLVAKYGSVQDIDLVPENLRQVFVTAMDIDADSHVRMQAAFQQFTDNAVSKTINLPAEATVDDVVEAFISAWELKCKGITIYRDKSRDVQVLNVGDGSGKQKVKKAKSKLRARRPVSIKGDKLKDLSMKTAAGSAVSSDDACPECGGKLMMQEGCMTCASCSYSACSV